ncbi:MAG: CYTH and CHAD domain-containing protein [Burkholderiales bacterium]
MRDVKGLGKVAADPGLETTTELELKLAVAPADAARLADHPLLRALAGDRLPQQQRMQARYLDTADGLLARAGMALRLRCEGDQWVQTFKTSSGAALALRSRGEWEQQVPEPKLDWIVLQRTPLARLDEFARLPQTLQPIFAIDFQRRSWQLKFKDGTRAIASLDIGEIACGIDDARRTEAISEFELEFESGRPATVWKLARDLCEGLTLLPLSASKGERGSALAGGQTAKPLKTRMPDLDPASDVHAALALALGTPLAALQHNLRQLDFADPEFVHQARVALRRMRSVLRAFDRLIKNRKLKRDLRQLAVPLKALGHTLGAARDADVFLSETLGVIAKQLKSALPETAADVESPIDRIAADATKRQQAAHDAVRAWLAKPAYGRLLLSAERLIFDSAHAQPAEGKPLALQLAKLLARQHQKVQHAAIGLTRQSAAERHRLRIEVKRLRYLLDIALPLFAQDGSEGYLVVLESLQQRLGSLNDTSEAGLQMTKQRAAQILRNVWAAHERKRLNTDLPRVARQLAALDLTVAPWHEAPPD